MFRTHAENIKVLIVHGCKAQSSGFTETATQYVQPTLLVSTSFLKPKKLLHLQVSWRDLAVNKAVGIFLLWTLQLLAVLIDVFQDAAAVGRRQLEPHLKEEEGDYCFSGNNVFFIEHIKRANVYHS